MKLNDFFIGKPIHWAALVVVIFILALLGFNSEHVRHFVPFIFAVLGLSAGTVAFVLLTYKPGDRVTREPIEEELPNSD